MLHELVDWLDANISPKVERNLVTQDQLAQQNGLGRRQAPSSVTLLLVSIPDVLWGTLVSVFCYIFAGRTQSKVDLTLGEKGHA
jgi:hypothetical protein